MNKLLLTAVLAMGTTTIATAQQQKPIYLDENQPIEARVSDALSRMTLEEKVALCTAQSKFSSHGVPRLGIPELWYDDGPHGVREELLWDSWGTAGQTNDACVAFPALTCLAATWNPDMSALYGKAVGEEFRYREKDVMLGPGVNIYRTPLNGRNFEYMGEDPYLASVMVVPYVVEAQKNGVATCVKHYLLNNQEIWRGHIDVEISDRALYEIYLPAFRAAIVEGKSWTIMGSYNKIRGQHGCHNDLTLNKILREEWGFDGAVVTDWGGAHDTKEAALYGLDVEMGSWTNGMSSGKDFAYDDYYLARPYLEALKNGSIPVETVDKKAKNMLRLIFRTAMNTRKPFGVFCNEEHYQVARKVGEEGVVLLRNEKSKKADALLPLNASKYKKILVVGENATRKITSDGGAAGLKVQQEVTALDGLKARFGDKIEYTMGYASGPAMYGKEFPSSYNTDSLRKIAVEKAKEADLIIYIGGLNHNHFQDCENGDRKSLNLPFGQNQLIDELTAVNQKMIMVLISGNAVAMPWINKVPSIVQAWYLGSETGNIIAEVVSGDVNPSGKLPFSFPVKLEDCGAHAFDALCYPGDSIKEIYKEDILVGYRWHDTKKIPALFAFGHGLSYTTFSLSNPIADKKEYTNDETITVKVTVKNTGAKAGAEVVQLYASDVKASVLRPVKELKAFDKVQLAAGESKEIELKVPIKSLAFFDEKKHDWTVEPGDFYLYTGNTSAGLTQKVKVTVK